MSQCHLLVVDDEPFNRELLRRFLQGNYRVSEAKDASEALAFLESNASSSDPVRLILCDHLMPGKTGCELSFVVQERWPNIPFVLLTGYDEDDSIVRARATGAIREILEKPWRMKELHELVPRQLNFDSRGR